MTNIACNIILDENSKELNLKGTKALPVAIYNDDLKEKPVPYHWHDEIELIVVISGEMELICELEKYVLKQGQGVFINSGRLHSCVNYDDTACIIKSFVFHSRFIYGDLSSILFEDYFHKFLAETSVANHLLSFEMCEAVLAAYEEFLRKQFGYEFFVREKLTQVLLEIIKSTDNNTKIDFKTIKQLNRCKMMMSFIHQNYQSEITLSQIASSAGIKESEALRCFKSTLKTSPIKYLKKYRLEKSAFLLKTTTEPIIDIGFACGFYEMSYFSKSFKEDYGMTPTEYRKNPEQVNLIAPF